MKTVRPYFLFCLIALLILLARQTRRHLFSAGRKVFRLLAAAPRRNQERTSRFAVMYSYC
jgi:hypothetical protein